MSPKECSLYRLSAGESCSELSEWALDSVLVDASESGHQNFWPMLASLRCAQSMFSSIFEIGIDVFISYFELINDTKLNSSVTKAAFSKSVSYISSDLNSTHQPIVESKDGGGLNLIEFQLVDWNYSKCSVLVSSNSVWPSKITRASWENIRAKCLANLVGMPPSCNDSSICGLYYVGIVSSRLLSVKFWCSEM